MSGQELHEFTIETKDGAEYVVSGYRIAIVASMLFSIGTTGDVYGDGQQFAVVLPGLMQWGPETDWIVVRDNSWSFFLQMLNSLRTVRAPHGAAAQPDSFTRLMLLKEEAVRRCRSMRFERLAVASRN